MYRILKKINISRKKKYLCFPSKRENILSKNFMSIENGWMILDINNLVFVEISGVNLGMTRLYGGGKVGERVVSNAPRNKQDLRIASIYGVFLIILIRHLHYN